MKEKKALIIFVRNPHWGSVKTRLAKDLGKDHAFRIYKYLLSITRKLAVEVEADYKLLFYDQHIILADGWDENTFSKHIQVDGNLGIKMHVAFETAFKLASKVVIIGSDCPSIEANDLHACYEQLETHDAVIGPSKDGGYYLLGLSKRVPELFIDMPWSTEDLKNQTFQKLDDLNHTYSVGRELNDIDDVRDWQLYQTTSDS